MATASFAALFGSTPTYGADGAGSIVSVYTLSVPADGSDSGLVDTATGQAVLLRATATGVEGYLASFPGYYASGDGGYIDEDGYLFVMGRTDDVINVAGHRLSTGEMEQIVASHPAIAECCVIGIPEPVKGQQPLALVLIKNGVEVDETILQAELVAMVRQEIGALACFKQAIIVQRLPKTRSGKILRKLLRQIADGSKYSVPSTIDDPASLPEIATLMAERGLISAP